MIYKIKYIFFALTFSIFGMVNVGFSELPQSQVQINFSFAPLVKKSSPAVVNIYTKTMIQSHSDLGNLFDDPIFKRFFGDSFRFNRPQKREQNSLGSGVVVTSSGIVVTNNHVIKGADEIRIVMFDRREFDADVVMVDERSDIAVLQIRNVKKKLKFLKFGDSDKLLVGDLVLAIGNPFGVGQTITSGIVSGLARSSVGISDFQSFIQTDAAINPGNSGGALIALNGDVVGINTMIFSKNGGSLGIGFAVPSNMVKIVVESAIKGERLIRPWLGFSGRDVTQDIADALAMERPMGVIVESVHNDGPAGESGLMAGDIILSIETHDIENAQDLRYRMATKGIGNDVLVRYMRENKIKKATFELIAPPEIPMRDEFNVNGSGPLQGAKIMNLSPALSDELGIPTDQFGVMVVAINKRSTAQRLGIKAGDKIISINAIKINMVADLRRIISNPPSEWHLVINRNGRKLVLDVR